MLCEELCRSRRSMPPIGYCLDIPNMVTVCRLLGFSGGTGDVIRNGEIF